IIATVFSDHFCNAVFPSSFVSVFLIKIVGILGIVLITLINATGARVGAKVANIFFILNVTALASIATIGIIASSSGQGEGIGKSSYGWFGTNKTAEGTQAWAQIGNLVTALFGALFCYGGWETVNPFGPSSIIV